MNNKNPNAVRLKCSICHAKAMRVRSDDVFGPCRKCGGEMVKQQSQSEKRHAKARIDYLRAIHSSSF